MRTIIAAVSFFLIGIATATIGSAENKEMHDTSIRHFRKPHHERGSFGLKNEDEQHHLKKHSTFDIEIDEGEIHEIIGDFKDLGGKWLGQTKKERVALMKSLREAYKNTAAKMLLNWGRVFPPVANSWADVMKYVQVNKDCD